MGTVQLHKAGFDHLRRVIIPGNADRLSCGAYRVHDQLRDLVQLLPVDVVILNQILILDVVQDNFTIDLSGSHPIRSHPCPRRGLPHKGLGI